MDEVKKIFFSLEVLGSRSIASSNDKISHWIGKIASRPCTNLKGVNLVALLIEVSMPTKPSTRLNANFICEPLSFVEAYV